MRARDFPDQCANAIDWLSRLGNNPITRSRWKIPDVGGLVNDKGIGKISDQTGIDAQLRSVCGALCAAVCLSSILLIGFAPVAWIFSQSTDSIAFMGALHLLFWVIGIRFGLRLIDATGRFLGARSKGHLRIWSVIFILVCFQMTTALRPIIAPSKTFLPTEKKFFLANWFDSINGK